MRSPHKKPRTAATVQGSVSVGTLIRPIHRPPKRPSQAALKLAREHDRPFNQPKDRAREARKVIACVAAKLTSWRRDGE